MNKERSTTLFGIKLGDIANRRIGGVPGMKAWRAMMDRKPGAGRYVHVSCQASMKDGRSIVSRGVTLNIGRNAVKRERSEMRARWVA